VVLIAELQDEHTVFRDALGAGGVDQSILGAGIAEERFQGLFVQGTFLRIRTGVIGHQAVDERIRRWQYSNPGERLDGY
jgi:hypothetical protein